MKVLIQYQTISYFWGRYACIYCLTHSGAIAADRQITPQQIRWTNSREKNQKKNNTAYHHFLSSKALPRLLLRESEPICWAVRCRIYESRGVQPIRFRVIRLIAVISFIWMTGECKSGGACGMTPDKDKKPSITRGAGTRMMDWEVIKGKRLPQKTKNKNKTTPHKKKGLIRNVIKPSDEFTFRLGR